METLYVKPTEWRKKTTGRRALTESRSEAIEESGEEGFLKRVRSEPNDKHVSAHAGTGGR